VLHLPHRELRDLYEADLALIRPDQHVAWRGSGGDAAAILARATGTEAITPRGCSPRVRFPPTA
jgi:hypothetical protein